MPGTAPGTVPGSITQAKVLIVEDNPANLELAAILVEVAGCVALTAEDALTGIALARSQRPALILMDISLPGMDGLTATGVLKRDPETRGIPVVALTAHAMAGDREKMLAAGCDGYLAKPYEMQDFLDTVGSLIGRSELGNGQAGR